MSDLWYPAYNTEYRVGLPTKIAHKASMHYAQNAWILCAGAECVLCASHLYAEKRYCLPVIVYKARGWVQSEVKAWEFDHLTSKVIGRIYQKAPGVDLLVTKGHSTGLKIVGCEDALYPGHPDTDRLRDDLAHLVQRIPAWKGYVPPKPKEPPPMNRMRLLMGS